MSALPESTPPRATMYIDGPFASIIAEGARVEAGIAVTVFDDDPELDMHRRIGELCLLQAKLNKELHKQGYLGAEVFYGPDIITNPESDEPEVDSDGTDLIENNEDDLLTGIYEGIFVYAEPMPEAPALGRLALYHKIRIAEVHWESPFESGHSVSFGFAPLANEYIQPMVPVASYLPNQGYVNKLTRELFGKGQDPRLFLKSAQDAYERLVSMKPRSKVPNSIIVDWFLDRLDEHIGFKGQTLELQVKGYFLQSGKVHNCDGLVEIEGVMLGFCEVEKGDNEKPTKGQSKQLAIMLEVSDGEQESVVAIPVVNVVPSTDD